MKKVPISDATDDQIRWFAQNVQQIADVPKARGAMLAALLQSGHSDDFVLVEGASDEPLAEEQPLPDQFGLVSEKPTPMPTSGFGFWRNSPMVTLRILPTDRPGGNEPAHPSINGSPPLVIQRNKLVSIPFDFYLVIKQAGGTKVLPGEKPTDPLILVDYYDYPLQDVTLPTADEVRKWQAHTSGHELGKAKAA